MKKTASKAQNSAGQNQNVALYTKYRPKKFSEVIGQEHVTAVLGESVKAGNVSHAYLFTGTRGTGKTSVARILAKELGTSDSDLYEIDAASNTSVENIRDLNESVNILPFDSEYKIYILDEVHMLSKSAFNALLKTLEEPPKFVVFILATTEPHKIPDTVISRCESYNFKTPNRAVLKKMIAKTAKAEGFELDPAAAELIAILGDGSFRDSQTILQKVFRTSATGVTGKKADHKIALEEVEKITGAPQNALINDALEGIVAGGEDGAAKSLSAIKTAGEANLDAKVFMKLLLEKYRALLLMKVAPNKKEIFTDQLSADDIDWLGELLSKHADRISSLTLLKLLESSSQMRQSYLPYLPLELVVAYVN